MPERIQLRRTKGWKLPPNTIVVTRATKWGNPFSVTPQQSRAQAVDFYRRWINGEDFRSSTTGSGVLWLIYGPQWIREHLHKLRGKNLACFCPLDGQPCHADVLLELANKTP